MHGLATKVRESELNGEARIGKKRKKMKQRIPKHVSVINQECIGGRVDIIKKEKKEQRRMTVRKEKKDDEGFNGPGVIPNKLARQTRTSEKAD